MRKSMLLLAAFAVMTVPVGTSASAAPTTWPACRATPAPIAELRAQRRAGDIRSNLWLEVCGPTRVFPRQNYSFTVVVTNLTDATYRTLKLAISHYEPLFRASRPYRREGASNGDPKMQGAVWMVRNLEPGRSFRVSFALPFVRHPDPKASNFEVDGFFRRGSGGYSSNLLGATHDVVFIRH